MRRFNIGIDVDGVIIDYMVTVRAQAELYDYLELHGSGLIDKEAPKVRERYGWSKEVTKTFADKYFVPLSVTAPYNPLAIEVMKMLQNDGHDLNVISNRGLIHEEATTVVENRFKKSDIIFSNFYWKIEDKTSIMIENNINIIIDDSYDVCMEAANKGLYAIYFREKGSKIIKHEKVFDVDNWGEIYRVITELSKTL